VENDPTRVNYREGQRLRAEDLTAEQEYLLALERNHNLQQHSAGIVLGLAAGTNWAGQSIIDPGVAVDAEGRPLVVEDDVRITAVVESCVDSWLVHCESEERARHPGRVQCNPLQFDRLHEIARIHQESVKSDVDPSAPAAGAVYLGRSGCGQKRSLEYASLTASIVQDPANHAAMQIGPATGRDWNGFELTVTGNTGAPTKRITLDRLGTNRFFGTMFMGEGPNEVKDEALRANRLSLKAWDSEAESPVALRGCAQPARENAAEPKGPNGLSFVAMKTAEKAPPRPGIFSISTGTAAAPAEQLRFDLGLKPDNDRRTRFAAGNRDANGVFTALLQIDGMCNALIPGPDEDTVMLVVQGTVEQAPLKADPFNPTFTNLLVAAWLAGLQRSVAASTVIALDFKAGTLPPLIESGQPFTYTLVVTNSAGREVNADGILETRTIAGHQLIPNTVQGPVTIPTTPPQEFLVPHNAETMSPGMMIIEAKIFGKMGNTPWWRANTSPPIPVVEPPTITLTAPDSIPAGVSWQQSFTIKNTSDRAVTLTQITVNGVLMNQFAGSPLPAGIELPFSLPDHAGVSSGPIVFAVHANFTWDQFALASSASQNKTIDIVQGLVAQLKVPQQPVDVQQGFQFTLTLKNKSDQLATLVSMKQRLSASDFAPIEAVLAIPNNPAVDDPQHITFNSVHAPATTALNVTLEVEVEYQLGGQTFKTIVSKQVSVEVPPA
jgi:hypothetical protein